MTGLAPVVAAAIAFVGTHFLMSHPLRAPIVGRIGEGAFLGVYSLVSFVTLGWLWYAAAHAPAEPPAWVLGDAGWAVASAVMLVASILLIGSLVGNPALPNPAPDQPPVAAEARGVFAITRHPMLWGFILWGLVHVAAWPTGQVIVVSIAIIVLALFGAAAQDAKKLKLRPGWREWMARTSFVPFAGQLSRRIEWKAAWPSPHALGGGIIVWLAATWAHMPLGAPVAAGVWRWILS